MLRELQQLCFTNFVSSFLISDMTLIALQLLHSESGLCIVSDQGPYEKRSLLKLAQCQIDDKGQVSSYLQYVFQSLLFATTLSIKNF